MTQSPRQHEHSLELEWLPGRYAVCRLDPHEPMPDWAMRAQADGFHSVTRTDEEVSIVAREEAVPQDARCERGWVALRIVGQLDFALIGILARLTSALAHADISVFAISTFDTDYLFVKLADAQRAATALRNVATIRNDCPVAGV